MKKRLIKLWHRLFTCRIRCGKGGYTLLRREIVQQNRGFLFGFFPTVFTTVDDRAACRACGKVHRLEHTFLTTDNNPNQK